MKFFKKLKEKLFSTSSKMKDGLEEIIDKEKDYNRNENETFKSVKKIENSIASEQNFLTKKKSSLDKSDYQKKINDWKLNIMENK